MNRLNKSSKIKCDIINRLLLKGKAQTKYNNIRRLLLKHEMSYFQNFIAWLANSILDITFQCLLFCFPTFVLAMLASKAITRWHHKSFSLNGCLTMINANGIPLLIVPWFPQVVSVYDVEWLKMHGITYCK